MRYYKGLILFEYLFAKALDQIYSLVKYKNFEKES